MRDLASFTRSRKPFAMTRSAYHMGVEVDLSSTAAQHGFDHFPDHHVGSRGPRGDADGDAGVREPVAPLDLLAEAGRLVADRLPAQDAPRRLDVIGRHARGAQG